MSWLSTSVKALSDQFVLQKDNNQIILRKNLFQEQHFPALL